MYVFMNITLLTSGVWTATQLCAIEIIRNFQYRTAMTRNYIIFLRKIEMKRLWVRYKLYRQ